MQECVTSRKHIVYFKHHRFEKAAVLGLEPLPNGRPTYLNASSEKKLVDFVRKNGAKGMAMTKGQLMEWIVEAKRAQPLLPSQMKPIVFKEPSRCALDRLIAVAKIKLVRAPCTTTVRRQEVTHSRV